MIKHFEREAKLLRKNLSAYNIKVFGSVWIQKEIKIFLKNIIEI